MCIFSYPNSLIFPFKFSPLNHTEIQSHEKMAQGSIYSESSILFQIRLIIVRLYAFVNKHWKHMAFVLV